jgi:hypothetical protein
MNRRTILIYESRKKKKNEVKDELKMKIKKSGMGTKQR